MKVDTPSFIRFGLALESALFAVKLIALFIVTGAALFSETLHSLTDVMNSVFLYIGIRLSRRKPDPEHPFGYGMETFFWAFLTAMFMITVSATFSIFKGIEQLAHPEPLSNAGFGIWAMAAGTLISLITLAMGLEIIFRRGEMSLKIFMDFVDPTVKVKVAEDICAVIGNVLVLAALLLYEVTGNVVYDASVGILVGVILAVLGALLALESKDLIIGRSAGRRQRILIARAALSVSDVIRVMELKTMLMGPDDILVNIEVNLKKDLDTDTVEQVMDDIRARIQHAVPQARQIQVEVESL